MSDKMDESPAVKGEAGENTQTAAQETPAEGTSQVPGTLLCVYFVLSRRKECDELRESQD